MQLANASPATAQESKDNSPVKSLLLGLGVPAGVVTAGRILWTLFLQGEAIQKSGKAWFAGLRRKADTPAAASSNPSGAQAPRGNDNQFLQQVSAGGGVTVASGDAEVHNESAGRDLVQRDQVQRDQYNAPANVTNAQTVNQYFPASEPQRERILSTIDPPPQGVGVMGREQQLMDLESRMGEPGNNRRLVVHGEPGVGKSELLREYGRRQQRRYPGGRYWIDCRLNLAQEIAKLGRQCWQMTWLEGPLEEQAMEVLQLIAKEKVLLLIDNATDEAQVEPFLPPAGQAHVLLSSTSRDWGPPLVEVWRPEGLQRLDPAAAMAVLTAVAGAPVAEQVGKTVIAEVGGLPVHLLPTARTLARRVRLGRLSESDLLQLSAEGMASFSRPWDVLDPAERLLLQTAGRWFNPNALVEAELVAALADGFQGEAAVRDAVDGCRDLYLLQGEGRLTMHQLLVQFVDSQPPQRLGEFGAKDLGPVVAFALGKAAERLEESPADDEALAALQCHQLSWDFWRQHPDGLNSDACHHVGEALQVLGSFAEASSWFEAAATLLRRAAELDHLALGDNLNEIGNCFYFQGKWIDAKNRYEQAISILGAGDHGNQHCRRVAALSHFGAGNCAFQQGSWQEAMCRYKVAIQALTPVASEASLCRSDAGRIFHMMGACAMQEGNTEDAINFLANAVLALEEGDAERGVDHSSIGRSLHLIGSCFAELDHWSEASFCFQRAILKKSKGDSSGRVDLSSVSLSRCSLGICAYKMEEFAISAECLGNALSEQKAGDLHSRVDHHNIGVILSELGNCSSLQHNWEEAFRFYTTSVSELSLGDVHGRVDSQRIGETYDCLGNCADQMRNYSLSASLYAKAVDEKRKGDAFGRTNEKSIALSSMKLSMLKLKT